MPTREEILADRTHKHDGIDAEKRVLYTLQGDTKVSEQSAVSHRNSKAIALLFKTLIEAGTVSDEQLDEILLQVTW